MPDDSTRVIVAKRDGNSRSPINRLPAELLTIIFALVQDHYKSYGGRVWIGFLSVCSRWYLVGMQAPLLWSTITTAGGMNEDRVRDVLRRSGAALLDIRMRKEDIKSLIAQDEGNLGGRYKEEFTSALASSRYTAVVVQVLRQIHRIRSLGATYDMDDNRLLARLLGDAPMLKRLELCMQNTPRETITISSLLPFAETLRNLDTLKLYNCPDVAGVLRAPDIRVLHIHQYSRGSPEDEGYLAKDIFNTIRGMPLLEDLCLDHAVLFPLSLQELPMITPLDLPNLKALALVDRMDTLFRILKHLNIPLSASLDLIFEPKGHIDMSYADIASLQRVLRAVESAGHTTITKHRTIHALAVESTMISLRFIGCSHSGGCVGDKKKHCVFSTLNIAFIQNNTLAIRGRGWYLGGFDEVMGLLPLQEVKALSLKGGFAYNSLRRRLGLPAVQNLPTATAYHLNLKPPSVWDSPSLDSSLRCQFPNLRTMYVTVTFPWIANNLWMGRESKVGPDGRSEDDDPDVASDEKAYLCLRPEQMFPTGTIRYPRRLFSD